MTMPGFVERGKVIASLPSLGLLTLAGRLPPHWEPIYFEVDEVREDLIQRVADSGAHLVAISSLTARILEAYKVADTLRENGVTVIIGGLHASVLPSEASQHADSVVIGEGEAVWPQLVEDFERGCLQPVYDARLFGGASYAFADGGLPRYDLLDVGRYNRITLQTSRGCPLDCAFCAASRLISPYRRKPMARVAAELESILSIWPKPFIELADDNTFVHKKWSKELAKLLSSYPVRWFTESDISVADDDELLELLAVSGCAQVLVGLESVARQSLSETDSKAWKLKKRQSYLDRIRKIQSYGISVNGCFVLGFDHDDEGIFQQTVEFVEESGLTEVQVTVLTPFPGTALYAKLLSGQILPEEVFWDKCTLFDVAFVPKLMSTKQLEDGLRWLAAEIYNKSRTEKRTVARKGLARAKRVRDKYGLETSAA